MKTVTITPTWAGTFMVFVEAYRNTGKPEHLTELARMAELADKWVAHCQSTPTRRKVKKTITLPPVGCSEQEFHAAAEKLRAFLKAQGFTKAPKHDDINVIELYDDVESDEAFIDYMGLPHKVFLRRHSPSTYRALYST